MRVGNKNKACNITSKLDRFLQYTKFEEIRSVKRFYLPVLITIGHFSKIIIASS